MYYQDLIPDALESASTRDISDELFVRTVIYEAILMAGINSDEILWEDTPDIH